MAAKKKARKKAGTATKVVDPRAPIKPTPAALKDTLEQVSKGLEKLTPPEEPAPGDLVYAMLHILFADGLSDGVGQEVVRRVETGFVDRNEFRVTEAFQMVELIEDMEIPDKFDRCLAVRNAVAEVYNDQNAVNLDYLREATVSERNQFFQRVPAIEPWVAHYLVATLSFEECLFSPRSTVRVQMRLGFDPKSSAQQSFFQELRDMLAPWGHMPLLVGPNTNDGKVIEEPVLAPASLILRLGPPPKKKR